MLRVLTAFVLLLQGQMLPAQYLRVPFNKGGSAAVLPPTIDHRFPVSNPANTCGVGVACANGAAANGWKDIVGTVVATNVSGVATYVASAQNSQPGWDFHGGDQFTLSPTIAVPSVITLYWFGKPANTTGNLPMFGSAAGSNSIEWRISAGKQQLINAGLVLLVQGNATLSTTNYSALVATFDNTTGTGTVYLCSAGSATVDGTGSPGVQSGGNAMTNNIDRFGTSGGDPQFQGGALEQGVGSGVVSPSSICAWAQSNYGIS